MLWVEYKKIRKPVPFARATGDRVFNAIIWDVVVGHSFQGIGLGKAVLERLIEELLENDICNITLYSVPRVLGFYQPIGFVVDPDGIRGMVYSIKPKKRNSNTRKYVFFFEFHFFYRITSIFNHFWIFHFLLKLINFQIPVRNNHNRINF
ncbi:hypothetical protein REPUB_Repub04eG0231500 [Reevesia pubescens]